MTPVATTTELNVAPVTVIGPESQGSAASKERRAAPRTPYPGVRLAACCNGNVTSADGLDFRLVVCFDVSSSGISFLMPDPPDFHHAVVKLGASPDAAPVVIEVARCNPHNGPEGGFHVGCRFVRLLKGSSTP